jgi:hypothetical protein
MIGYTIGCIISALLLSKYTRGRKLTYQITLWIGMGAICILSLWLNLGWWNIISMPAMSSVIAFISLLINPYTPNEVINNSAYSDIISEDFYTTIKSGEIIGQRKAIGFKQEYDELLLRTLLSFTSDKKDAIEIANHLYTKIHYPVSQINKDILEQHVVYSIEKTVSKSPYLLRCYQSYPEIKGAVFNIWLSQLTVHEKATKELELLQSK